MGKLIDENFEFLVILLGVWVILLFAYNLLTIEIYLTKKIKSLQTPKPRRYHIPKKAKQIVKFRLFVYAFVNILILALLGVTVYALWKPLPKVLASDPANGGVWEDPKDYLEVEFSRPVKVEKLEMNLAPELEGEWKTVKPFKRLPFVTKMRFYPKKTVMPGEEVIIYAVGYNPKKIGEHMIEFKSPLVPEVQGSTIDAAATNFPPDANLEFQMDNNLGDYLSWQAEINPPIEFEISEDRAADKLIITPKTSLKLSSEYTIKILRSRLSLNTQDNTIAEQSEFTLIHEVKFTTDKSAIVTAVEPSGTGVLTTNPVIVKFGKELDKATVESLFRLEPKIEGTISWDDNLTLRFTPQAPFEKATNYSVIIGQGLEYQPGVKTKADLVFNFETVGYVKVKKFGIANGSKRVSVRTTISTEFNQEVDKASAQGAFSISPDTKGTFSWNGNTMVFKANSNLAYNKNYTVTIKKGVKSINGIDSNEEFKTSFTTAPELFMLSVPYYRQVRRFECELLATKMVLAYRGIYMSADQIMREIGVSTVPYNSSNNTWGDPNVYFVGDVTGASKGYGVHLDPLARVARAHGRSATVHRGWSVAGIANEVQKGNPVIILWQNGWSTPTNISWNTPEGKRIHAINGTHAGVVIGFKGPADAPTSMIVQDLWYRGGSYRTYSISSFNGLWNYHGRSALVIN